MNLSQCPYRSSCPHLAIREEQFKQYIDLAVEEIKKRDTRIEQLEKEIVYLKSQLKEVHQAPFKRGKKKEAPKDGEKLNKKRGAPIGHCGATREKPIVADEYIDVIPERCPICGSTDLGECEEVEEHWVEDIEIKKKKVKCYRKYHRWCKKCKRVISVKGEDEQPKSYIGPVAKAVAGHLRYGIGISYGKTKRLFDDLFGLDLSKSAFVGFDKSICNNGKPFYELLESKVRWSNWLCVDETGWPLGYQVGWLWVFTNDEVVVYRIHRSRGSVVVEDVLGKEYGGVLTSDRYSSYNPIHAKDKQKCFPHLFRDIKKAGESLFEEDLAVKKFLAKLKVLLREAMELKKEWEKGKISSFDEITHKRHQFEEKLDELIFSGVLQNENAEKLRKGLIRHKDELFTFLKYKDVPPDNNRAERALRPNVILRKLTYGNNSDVGARNHEVIMSLIETTRLNGKNPLELLISLLNEENDKIEGLLFGVNKEKEKAKHTGAFSFP